MMIFLSLYKIIKKTNVCCAAACFGCLVHIPTGKVAASLLVRPLRVRPFPVTAHEKQMSAAQPLVFHMRLLHYIHICAKKQTFIENVEIVHNIL